jgi:hypothetical protein
MHLRRRTEAMKAMTRCEELYLEVDMASPTKLDICSSILVRRDWSLDSLRVNRVA